MRPSLRLLLPVFLLHGAACIPEDEDGSVPARTEQGSENLGAGGQNGRQNLRRDFNRDGLPDLLWFNKGSGQISAWHTDGNLHVQSATNGDKFVGLPAKAVGLGDVNFDGDLDLVIHDPIHGAVAVWPMRRLEMEIRPALRWSVVESSGWKAVSGGDMNHDGLPDLIWHHANDGVLSFWYDLRAPTQVHQPSARAGRGWRPVGVGDFDENVMANDVVWFNASTRQVVVWFMSKQAELVSHQLLSVQPDPGWVPLNVQDVNGDGRPDIVWQNTSTRVVSAWLMRGTEVTAMRNFDFVPDPGWNLVP